MSNKSNMDDFFKKFEEAQKEEEKEVTDELQARIKELEEKVAELEKAVKNIFYKQKYKKSSKKLLNG